MLGNDEICVWLFFLLTAFICYLHFFVEPARELRTEGKRQGKRQGYLLTLFYRLRRLWGGMFSRSSDKAFEGRRGIIQSILTNLNSAVI